jgi:integrase
VTAGLLRFTVDYGLSADLDVAALLREMTDVYALHARLGQALDAVHDGILPRSPVSRRTSPGAGKQRPYVATTAQVWALHDAVPEHMRVAVLLGAFAGLRTAEAVALRLDDVDFTSVSVSELREHGVASRRASSSAVSSSWMGAS